MGDGGVGRTMIQSLPIEAACRPRERHIDATLTGAYKGRTPDVVGVEEAEYYVRVNWIKAVSKDQAVKEKGFFGNQNSAAKPRTKKWQHTVERLKKRFGVA